MAYEERKKRRLRKRKIKRILVLCVFGYLILKSISGVMAKNARTILTEEHKLVDSKEAQGVLIMEESVFEVTDGDSTKDGHLEGQRVPVGYKISEASFLSDVSTLKEELKHIDETIEVLSKSNKENQILEKDKKEISKDQEKLIQDLKDKIHVGDYSDIDKIKDSIGKGNNKISDYLSNNTLINQSLESLNSRRDILLEQINGNNLIYTSPMAGMLSYKIDGYEKLFIPKDFENYTYDNLNIPRNTKQRDKKDDFNGFKIINNFEWYIALKIEDSKDMKSYEVGNSIILNLLSNKEHIEENIRGTVVAINDSNEKKVIVVKFTTNLEDYYEERFPEVSIIMSTQNVYKLPKKTLIDKEGQIGVYIKELNGIVKFKPLSIIEEHKDYVYVDKGDEGYIEIEGYKDPIKTITPYDEIFANPLNIKEGQILD